MDPFHTPLEIKHRRGRVYPEIEAKEQVAKALETEATVAGEVAYVEPIDPYPR